MCTVHSFPHNIDHCLTFARSEFEGLLEKSPSEANAFLSDPAKYLTAVRQVSFCILLPGQHARSQSCSVWCSAGHSCGALNSSAEGLISSECAIVWCQGKHVVACSRATRRRGEQLEKVVEVLDTKRCRTFEDCIAWARHRFQVRHKGR